MNAVSNVEVVSSTLAACLIGVLVVAAFAVLAVLVAAWRKR